MIPPGENRRRVFYFGGRCHRTKCLSREWDKFELTLSESKQYKLLTNGERLLFQIFTDAKIASCFFIGMLEVSTQEMSIPTAAALILQYPPIPLHRKAVSDET